MKESYCIVDKRVTPCTEPSGYQHDKRELQKKAVNYGINKLTPLIQDSVGTAMDEMSTKVRPKKKYKTDRKDLDGRSGKGISPMTVVKKAPDIAMKTTQELIPSLKPVYDRYKSGDFFKSALEVNMELHQRNSGDRQQRRKRKQWESYAKVVILSYFLRLTKMESILESTNQPFLMKTQKH